jgi:hypothetical protein
VSEGKTSTHTHHEYAEISTNTAKKLDHESSQDKLTNAKGSVKTDAKSRKSSRSTTKSSGRSSIFSSIASMRIKEEQKKAELQIRFSAQKRRDTYERAKLDIRLKQDELAIKEEEDVVDARIHVLDQYALENDS